ncbi:hypothetical protein [Nonomuraea africana]|uniref:Lipopolysaccharide biosynthesis protein n=1 Tax=Nonomuraea africana TaxID=46171 RepID=A0ABR9KTG3_9ACTN|nr:hypothetical protein [Nonomuraea africana]MBE1565016.1 hypothetical protein [Nonomuraea africana]
MLRRWYVAIPALLLTLAGSYGVYKSIPPQYQSSAVLSLTVPISGPSTLGDPRDRVMEANPLLNFNYGLNMTAEVLVQILGAEDTMIKLGARPHGETTYEVNNGSPNPELLFSQPFVLIEGKSSDPRAAKEIVQRVTQRARVELDKRQAQLKAPPTTYIIMTEILEPTDAVALRNDAMRYTAAVLLLGALASVAAAFVAESVAAALRRRRRDRSDAAASAPVNEPVLQR